MQAALIRSHGGPEVLSVEEQEQPEAGAGEVLVRVTGVSLNHLDLWTRRGMPGVKIPFPRILGCDGTGEVVELGEGVHDLLPGDRVVLEPGFTAEPVPPGAPDHLQPDYRIRGEHCDGFCCELVALPREYLLPLPAGLDPVHAAAMPLVFLTAWGMLVTRAQLIAGETCLVLGAASGVGSAAVQIAKDLGARVIATAGSEAKRSLARELGADEVLDHGREDWGRELRELTAGAGCDVVFEHVGPATWDVSMRALARNGRLVTCGGTTGPMVQLALPHLFIKNQSILGSTMGPRSALETIFERAAEGRYRPVVDRVLPLSEVARAHALLEAREVVGKLVLVPGS